MGYIRGLSATITGGVDGVTQAARSGSKSRLSSSKAVFFGSTVGLLDLIGSVCGGFAGTHRLVGLVHGRQVAGIAGIVRGLDRGLDFGLDIMVVPDQRAERGKNASQCPVQRAPHASTAMHLSV